ncbi:MAG: hypothetical protein J0L92_32030, partial [Deltaproteobacteria bacterium]|nr:hypothetical protein [Deltaproteobacteria bacterium]
MARGAPLFSRVRRGVEVLLVSLALASCDVPLSILEEPDANVDSGAPTRVVSVTAPTATPPAPRATPRAASP